MSVSYVSVGKKKRVRIPRSLRDYALPTGISPTDVQYLSVTSKRTGKTEVWKKIGAGRWRRQPNLDGFVVVVSPR